MKPVRQIATLKKISVVLLSCWLAACSTQDSPEQLIGKAKSAIQSQDNKAAEIHLKNLLQQGDSPEGRYLLGKLQFDQGDLRSAEKELGRAVEGRYNVDESVPQYFETLLAMGEVDRVIRETDLNQVTTPQAKARLLQNLGRAYMGQRKTEQARTKFKEALNLDPKLASAKAGNAILMAIDGQSDQAMAEVETILKESPNSVEALSLKADLLIALNKLAEAKETLITLIKAKPTYLPARSKLTAILLDLNDEPGAREQLGEIKKIAPETLAFYQLTAQVELKAGNVAKANEAAQTILKSQPDYIPALIMAANTSLTLNSLESAELYSRTLVNKAPNVIVGYRILGATQLRLNQPNAALATVETVLTKGVKDSMLYAIAGEAALKLNQIPKAEQYFKEATQLDPKDPAKRTGLAFARIASGSSEQGIADLEAAVSLETKGFQADYALIMASIREKKFDKAISAVRVLEKKPGADAVAANLEGLVGIARNDNAAARAAFEKSLSKNPKFYPAAANLAALDYQQNKPEDAKKRFENILKSDKANFEALLALSQHALRFDKDSKAALGYLETARRENSGRPGPVLASANLMMQLGDPKQAILVLQDAVAQNIDSSEILEALGLAQMQAGDRSQAISTFQKLVNQKPNNAQAHYRLGEVQLASKDEAAAIQSFNRAIELQPSAIEPRVAIAQLHLKSGRKEDARKIVAQVRKEMPNSPVGLNLEGDIAFTEFKWTEAIAAYRKSLQMTPNQPQTIVKLHQSLARGPRPSEADALLTQIVNDYGKNFALRSYVAEVEMGKGNFKAATEHYASLLAQDPRNPTLLNNVAWTAFKAKDPKAIDYAEQAYQLAPQSPQVLDTLGVILVDQGKAERGLSLLRQAVAAAPRSAELRLHLAESLKKTNDFAAAKQEIETLLKDTPTGIIADMARKLQATL